MDIEEIKRKYSGQWVLIEYDELDVNLEVKRGQVLAHSSNKEEIYKALSKTVGKNVSVDFVGPVPPDLAVMFFAE